MGREASENNAAAFSPLMACCGVVGVYAHRPYALRAVAGGLY